MANDIEIQEFFGFPIEKEVKVNNTDIYGFASCSNIYPEWRCQQGGFLKVFNVWKTEMQYIGLIHERFQDDEDCYYNFAFFLLKEQKDGNFTPVSLIKSVVIDDNLEKLDQSSYSWTKKNGRKYGCVSVDMIILIDKEKMEKFEWEY